VTANDDAEALLCQFEICAIDSAVYERKCAAIGSKVAANLNEVKADGSPNAV
jgi:hypothetical protein